MQKPFVTQAELFVSSSDLERPALHALDDTEAVLDWSKIEQMLPSIYGSKTGSPSYPLLTLFRGLLLGVWYRLSDVQLSQYLYRDLLFRKFCHLELGGDVPEASTLGRFRNQLGPVDIHLVRMIIAPMCIMASKLVSVLHARIAKRLNSLSL